MPSQAGSLALIIPRSWSADSLHVCCRFLAKVGPRSSPRRLSPLAFVLTRCTYNPLPSHTPTETQRLWEWHGDEETGTFVASARSNTSTNALIRITEEMQKRIMNRARGWPYHQYKTTPSGLTNLPTRSPLHNAQATAKTEVWSVLPSGLPAERDPFAYSCFPRSNRPSPQALDPEHIIL